MSAFFEEVFAIAYRDWVKREKLWKIFLGVGIIGGVIYAFGFGLQQIVKPAFAVNYQSFFSFGFLVFYIFVSAMMFGSDIILDRKKFVRLLLVAPISKYSILVGKTVSLLANSLKVIILLGILFLFASVQFSIIKVITLPLFSICLMLAAIATGLFVSSLFESKVVADQVLGWVSFVVLFASGVLFPISSLPSYFQMVLKFNPFIYIVDLFRYLMLGTNEFLLLVDITVSACFGILMIFLGVYSFDRNMRK
jgi:ABC-2 type transport system permease protein